ncbi:uncharacterized protein LOC111342701 [Stylophora pistillata]|uniref:Uncharacterized protein n=1 Tax=Stylophora pistillata TaxID=50429 RepID=A0A2B4RGX0_STYPI|nr:uncharacterized protein LOC111342701 [Stylophora pistillata]PFX16059.1 hypothetical protein AWC38_SpisGene19687 [Stylophora pistillata]
MGTAVSQKIKEEQEKEQQQAQETLEKLQMLQEMMVNKVAAATATMKDEARQNGHLPIVAFVDTSEKYSVNVSDVPATDINNAVKDLFGGNILKGLEDLIGVALKALLGNAQAGASEQKDFHIVFGSNSLLRVDFMFYKYEFSSKGVKDDLQNGFCYCTQTSVLDLKKVNPQVLLYELTRAIGQENISAAVKELKTLVEFGEDLYSVINELNKAAEKSNTDSDASDDGREGDNEERDK